MRFGDRLPAILIGAAAITAFSNAYALVEPQIAVASPAQNVSKIAKEITVLIYGPNLGSGVIINQQGNTYTVLTNWHVLEQGGIYTIQTSDKREYRVNSSFAKRLPGVDLAIVQFTSNQKYSVANLGDSDAATEGTTVYIAGAPEPSRGLQTRTVLVPNGSIIGRQPPDQDGYALIYNNNTHRGMSGGPVLDESGRLIGIHGRGARDNDGGGKIGFNLGIPINTYRELASRFGWGATAAISPPRQISQPPVATAPPVNNITGRYVTLSSYLAAARWQEADKETQAIMLKLADRESESAINEASIPKFPCQDLRTIDNLWRQYSNGRFGFSTQKRIWLDVGGQPGNSSEAIFERFADKLRWRIRGSWISYNNLTFTLDGAPTGHLPRRFLDGQIWGIFFYRLENCNL